MLTPHDQERFMRLWTSTQFSVASYIRSVVRDHAAAEDLLQETALVIFRRFPEYDADRPFVGWALGIARFQIMGRQRDAGRNRVVLDNEVLEKLADQWVEQAGEQSARAAALDGCMEKLAGKARQMVQLRYFEDLTAEQIAQRLGTKGPSIRVALQRIREQLRLCVDRQTQIESRI
jgi:RNA polymerase sigma-70 factor (ECF subfamily)